MTADYRVILDLPLQGTLALGFDELADVFAM
jgi:hypothetical protein